VAQTVKWTDIATEDLEEVAEFIARDSVFYARVVVREAREAARSLRRFAERGRLVPEAARSDIREIFVRDYRLIYHLSGQRVFVIAFIHGARDLAALWGTRGAPQSTGA
jgi:toxin ParE1/3/4